MTASYGPKKTGEITKLFEQALEDLKNGVLPKMINGVVQEVQVAQEKPKEREPGEEG